MTDQEAMAKELLEKAEELRLAAVELIRSSRAGAAFDPVEDYLSRKRPGDFVCTRQILDACGPAETVLRGPTRSELKKVAARLNTFQEWEKAGRMHTANYGRQRCWRKKLGAGAFEPGTLPF